MRYEGDVPSGWGNLTGQEMASYFWMAGLSGGYPTHGETLQNNSDTTEVRWWAKGGTLVGESPERIAFFKTIMEEVPVKEMKPELYDNGNPENLNNNVYVFSKPGEYYLAYVSNEGETITIELMENKTYQLEVIDTWNMNSSKKDTVEPGSFVYKTTGPYTAIRIAVKNE